MPHQTAPANLSAVRTRRAQLHSPRSARPIRRRSGRFVEVLLLLVALAVLFASFGSIMLTRTGSLPPQSLQLMGMLLGFALVTHLVVRYFTPYADPILLPTAFLLNGLGLVMIYRLDLAYRLSAPRFVVGYKQAVFTLLGIVLMILTVALIRDYRKLRAVTYTAMVAAILLLLLPLVPGLGVEINGARIWISLGFSFQPSEMAKIALVVFFAGYLMVRREALATAGRKLAGITFPRVRDLGPLALVWVFSILILVFEHDLGTSLLIFGSFVALLYVATNRVSWLVIGGIAFIPAVWVAYLQFAHVRQRFDVWLHALDPEIYSRARGGSGQLVSGLFGMADGGLLGTGLAQGSPSLTTFANSDFIFASLGEELGLVGAFAILVIYLIFVERGFRTAMLCKDEYGKLLACGLAFTVGFQVFVVVGGITRVIPSTGLTLPFMAMGGSSLIANWIILGLLLRISSKAREPLPELTSTVDTAELELLLDRNLSAVESETDSTAPTRVHQLTRAQARAASSPTPPPAPGPRGESEPSAALNRLARTPDTTTVRSLASRGAEPEASETANRSLPPSPVAPDPVAPGTALPAQEENRG